MDWKPFFIQRWLEQVRMKTFCPRVFKADSHCQDFQKHHQSFCSLMKQIFIFKEYLFIRFRPLLEDSVKIMKTKKSNHQNKFL
jgi:hypothetical protein